MNFSNRIKPDSNAEITWVDRSGKKQEFSKKISRSSLMPLERSFLQRCHTNNKSRNAGILIV